MTVDQGLASPQGSSGSSAARIRAAPALFGLARARSPLFTIGIATVIAYDLVLLLPGLVLAAFFDDLTSRQPVRLGPYALLALLTAIAVGQGVLALSSAAEPVVRTAVEVLLRRNLLAAALRRRPGTALPGSAGEAVGRLRDDAMGVSNPLTYALDPLGALVMVGIALWVLARTSLWLTIVVVLPALAALLLVNVLRRRVVAVRHAAQQSAADVTSLIGETFAALTTVKGAGAETRLSAEFGGRCRRRRRAAQLDAVLSQTIDSLSRNLATIAIGVVLMLIPTVAGRSSFTVGDLALFVSYLTQVGTVIGFVGQYARLYRQLEVSLHRLRPLLFGAPPGDLVRRDPPPAPPAIASPPLETLELRGLTYLHPTGGGIRDVDLTLPAGTLTVVCGSVGSGKTTLLRRLLGQLPASRGEILWNGRPVADPAAWFVPPRCAYAPQLPALLTASVGENVALDDGEVARGQALQALSTAAFDPDLEALPEGPDTRIGPRGARLSGGQAQRVAVARACPPPRAAPARRSDQCHRRSHRARALAPPPPRPARNDDPGRLQPGRGARGRRPDRAPGSGEGRRGGLTLTAGP